MPQLSKPTVILSTIIAILFVAVLYLLYLNLRVPNKLNIVQPTPTPVVQNILQSQSSKPAPSDWITYYQDYKSIPTGPTLFNLEFKYPAEWFTEGVPNSDATYFSIPSYDYPGVLVLDVKPNNNMSTEDIIKQEMSTYELVSNINVKGLNGLIVSDPKTMGNSVYVAYINTGSYIISLKLTTNPPDIGNEPLEVLNQILSTFKFTTATSISDLTSNWKTYENKEYGISFQYPLKINRSTGEYNLHLIDVGNLKYPNGYMPLILLSTNLPTDPPNNGDQFNLLFLAKPDSGKSLSEEAISFKSNEPPYPTPNFNHQNIKIDGQDTYFINNQQSMLTNVFVKHGKFVYTIGSVNQNDSQSVDLFKQILSTIKFL